MKITLARHSGFCMGVRSAVLKIVRELNSPGNLELFVYGPLIHNPQTMDALHNRGLKTLDSTDDIQNRTVAIRTHGIPNEERLLLQRGAGRVINLTCPRVAKVQSIIKKYSSQGSHTVITGDRDHAEVRGLISYARHGATVVSDPDELESIPQAGSYLVVSQTTFDRDVFLSIARRMVESHPGSTVVDTICDATRLRQDDVIQGIDEGIDTLVVVGGKNSANTKRLARIGRDRNIRTFHVETEHELSKNDFRNSRHVLVTAGTSTPGWIINNVLDRLYTIQFSVRNLFTRILFTVTEFTVRSNLLASAGAFFMTLVTLAYSDIPMDYSLPLISFLYIFSMYSINNILEKRVLKLSNPFKYRIYRKFGTPILILSIVFLAVSVMLAFRFNWETAAIVGVASLLGLIYSTSFVKSLVKKIHLGPLKIIYSSKIITSLGWCIITVLVPMMAFSLDLVALLALFSFVFLLVFLRSTILDLIAFQGDIIIGRESLPLLIGTRRFRLLTGVVSILCMAVFTYLTFRLSEWPYLFLGMNVIYYLVLIRIIERLNYLISLKYEVLTDLNLVAMIIISIAASYAH